MAVARYSEKTSLAAIDIILSCSICQEPLPAIYAENDENRGLRKGDNPHDGRVTKLWLTECCHLSCGRHFEGGGVPFHSAQRTPSAPCPLCVTEKNDRSDKALFYICGTAKGEYDSNIPDSYFQTPPVTLGGTDPGFDALLFQYLSLIRFGAGVYGNALRTGSALRRWEERKPEIVRSLSTVAPLRDELLAAGRRLIALGQDVASIEAVLNSTGVSLSQDLQRRQDGHQVRKNSALSDIAAPSRGVFNVGSRLAQGSVADLHHLTKGTGVLAVQRDVQPSHVSKDESSAKRKREDPLWDLERELEGSRRYEKGHSRDLMPPPPLPEQPYVFMVRVPTPELEEGHSLSTVTTGPGPATPPHQDARLPTNPGNQLQQAPRWRPGHRLLLEAMEAAEEATPRGHAVNTARRMQHPFEFDSRPINIEDLSSQAVSSTSTSYRDDPLPAARPSSEALPQHLRTPHRPAINPSPGQTPRLTLPPRSSTGSNNANPQRHGLSGNIRTSNDRLGAVASPHFGRQNQAYSSSVPYDNSENFGGNIRHMNSFDSGPRPATGIRHVNSFDTGPTAINGEMRPYSSTQQANNFLLAQDPTFEQARRRREQALSTQPSFAERMQRTEAERERGPATPAAGSRRPNESAVRGASNAGDSREQSSDSHWARRPARR